MDTVTTTNSHGRTFPLRKFQDFSWSDLQDKYGQQTGVRTLHRGIGWMKEHDLAVEAYEATPGMEFEWWRDMISACISGLPIILTTQNYRGEKRRTTVIITQILSYRPNTTANMYVRSWGFAHPISYHNIVNVEVPKMEWL